MQKSVYYPKVDKNHLGDALLSEYGVTQGRRSSANLYSFYISDINTAFPNTYDDFMYPCIVAQLADDTTLFAENTNGLTEKVLSLLEYSKQKYQIPNIKKTYYAEMSENPSLENIQVGEEIFHSIDKSKGHKYLGMTFLPTNDFSMIIRKNINSRMGNLSRYYGWLNVNETTPIKIKLRILDNCMYSSLTYGMETWGDFSCVHEELRQMERTLLKSILKVKTGTSNDLIYHELKRGDIVSGIKDQQYNFFKKINEIKDGDAIVKEACKICTNDAIFSYYRNLMNANYSNDIEQRERRINESDMTMTRYYVDKGFNQPSCLYDTFINDEFRYIISRWRLSNHDLRIETDRYLTSSDGKKIKKPRNERTCDLCRTVGDEEHVIFNCPKYNEIRGKFSDLLDKNYEIKKFLNPCENEIIQTGTYLHEIETIRKS